MNKRSVLKLVFLDITLNPIREVLIMCIFFRWCTLEQPFKVRQRGVARNQHFDILPNLLRFLKGIERTHEKTNYKECDYAKPDSKNRSLHSNQLGLSPESSGSQHPISAFA